MPDDQLNGTNRNETNPFNRPDEQADQSSDMMSPKPTESEFGSGPSMADSTMPSTAPAAETEKTTNTETPVVDTTTVTPTPPMESEPATQPVEPAPAMTETTFAPVIASKKSKKGLIIGGVVGAFLLLGLGGSVAAYNLWYQNPDKVLVDSVVNAVKAKTVKVDGTFTWANDDMGLTITPNMQGNDSVSAVKAKVVLDSKSDETKMFDGLTVTTDLTVKKDGTLYFKLSNIKKAFEKVADSLVDAQIKQYEAFGTPLSDAEKAQAEQAVRSMYQPIIDKLDGQWIKVDAEERTSSNDERKCLAAAYDKFDDDKLAREVIDVYYQHKFVTVKNKLPAEGNSLGYELDFNEKQAKEFGKAFEKTTIGKELAKCDEDDASNPFEDDSEEDNSLAKSSVKVWVDRWSHELTKLSFEGELKDKGGTFSGDFTTDFNGEVKVDVPKDAKTFDEVFEGFDPFGLGAMTANSEPVNI